MMYRCKDCKKEFDKPRTVLERHGLDEPPYECCPVCPSCGSEYIFELPNRYCRCCGARLPEFRFDYCNEECRLRAEKLWLTKARRLRWRETDPVYLTVAETDRYNRENGTNLSYGRYVAQRLMERQRHDNRRKKGIS